MDDTIRNTNEKPEEPAPVSEDILEELTKRLVGDPDHPFILEGEELAEGEEVRQIPRAPMYGCPSAKDTPGNLPACMLNTFDGFVMTEV